MVEQHRLLAYRVARDYWLPGADRDDVRQIALIALWEAARCYRPGIGTFPSFAETVIRRRLCSAVRAARREKRQVLTDAAREDVLSRVTSNEDPARTVELRDDLARLAAVMRTLSPVEREGMRRVVNELPYVGRKDLDNGVQRARRKLRAA